MSQFDNSSINPKPELATPEGEFNPTIIKMNHENGLEHIAILDGHKLETVGSSELHSGIHPTYGRCIIVVSDASASIIPFA